MIRVRHRAVRRILGVGAAALPLLLLLGGVSAQSGPTAYMFTTVLDSQRDGLEATRCAAINANGTVAVQVRDHELGISKLITKSGAADASVVVVDTRPVADFPTFCDNGITLIPSDPSINADGLVAFSGESSPAHDTGGMRDRRAAPAPAGRVPGRRQPAHHDRSHDHQPRVSLNEPGQIAFEDRGIFLSNPDGTFTTIVGRNSPEFGGVGDASLNNRRPRCVPRLEVHR
jgi:hypothetical protein